MRWEWEERSKGRRRLNQNSLSSFTLFIVFDILLGVEGG